MNIEDIISPNRTISEIIIDLKEKTVQVPSWERLKKIYYPSEHEVLKDKVNLKDKIRKNRVEQSSRISIGLERLYVKRMTEFMFAIPVKRVYSNLENEDGNPNETRRAIMKAMEAIYRSVRIDSENLKRGEDYFATNEVFTIWYAVKKPNNLYGFPSEYKMKCKTYSPLDGVNLYPLIDEVDDMIAMSFEYNKTIGKEDITYFETYTADKHYIWQRGLGDGNWKEITMTESADGNIVSGEDIKIMKIPGVYACSDRSLYEELAPLRKEIEYTLSRNSNVIAYNSAPVLKISGGIKGSEDKGESQRVIRVENNGDVSYVSWQQAIEALKYHVDTMLKLYWMQAQIPDISFENMKGLGNIGYDARQTLLTDAHLKVGDESGVWLEFLDRECNVIKAFLKELNNSWRDEIDNVFVEHIIQPFIQNDELAEINKRKAANGGKAIESQLESIQRYGYSDDAQATLEQIQEEDNLATKNRADAFSMSNQVI